MSRKLHYIHARIQLTLLMLHIEDMTASLKEPCLNLLSGQFHPSGGEKLPAYTNTHCNHYDAIPRKTQ